MRHRESAPLPRGVILRASISAARASTRLAIAWFFGSVSADGVPVPISNPSNQAYG
jgi:hypothetical protein